MVWVGCARPVVWVTEVLLNGAGRQMVRDADYVHRLLTAATDSSSYLWALGAEGVLVVQSRCPLPAGLFRKTSISVKSREVGVVYSEGAQVVVAGVVSPTIAKTRAGRRSHRVPLSVEEVPGWLEKRLGECLSIEQVQVEKLSPSIGLRASGRVWNGRAAFSLTGSVTDPSGFAQALLYGVGPAKRFGCGLVLARAVAGSDL